jgi:hypothetical protein
MIRLGAQKLELHRWQWRFEMGWHPPYIGHGFFPFFNFIIAKHHAAPARGEYSQKGKHFKGIMFRWGLMYTMTMRSFKTPYWLRRAAHRLGIRLYDIYAFPIKIRFY